MTEASAFVYHPPKLVFVFFIIGSSDDVQKPPHYAIGELVVFGSKTIWVYYGRQMSPFLPEWLSSPAESREYKLFISHAWDYRDDYTGVVALLNAGSSFRWVDLSVTMDEPLPVIAPRWLSKSYRSIVHQLDEKIREADCVLVLAAMYVAHRGWLQSEIEAAQEFKKPIIAVKPSGQERVPEALTQDGITLVGWRTNSIIPAIRKYTAQVWPFPGEPAQPPLTPFSQGVALAALRASEPVLPPLTPFSQGAALAALGDPAPPLTPFSQGSPFTLAPITPPLKK